MHHAVSKLKKFRFADDTNILWDISKFEEFQLDLTNVSTWFCLNKLTLNSDKATIISFAKK